MLTRSTACYACFALPTPGDDADVRVSFGRQVHLAESFLVVIGKGRACGDGLRYQRHTVRHLAGIGICDRTD